MRWPTASRRSTSSAVLAARRAGGRAHGEPGGIEATCRILALADGAARATPNQAALSPRPGGAETKVLMLTTFDMDVYVYEALRAGASGFLLTDGSARAARQRHRHRRAGRGAALAVRDTAGDRGKRPTLQEGPPPELAELTARAVEVLQPIARELSHAEIAKELFLSETTAKTHVARVLMKSRLRDRVQAVVLA